MSDSLTMRKYLNLMEDGKNPKFAHGLTKSWFHCLKHLYMGNPAAAKKTVSYVTKKWGPEMAQQMLKWATGVNEWITSGSEGANRVELDSLIPPEVDKEALNDEVDYLS